MRLRWIFTLISMFVSSSSALVNIYGDSILAENTPIQGDLQSFAPAAKIQNFAKIGAGMRDGWVQSIPSIYQEHKEPIPITAILDGGGNDVNSVRQECVDMTPICNETILHVVDVTKDLIRAMIQDGVKNVVYVGFFYIKGFEKAVDLGNDSIKQFCQSNPHCYFVDLRSLPVQVGWDGMHPVEYSYHDISARIWKTVQENQVPFE